jgi:putative ABC transport system permease protein
MPFRQILVAAQVALTTLVLVVAGGALQSLSILRKADPGFRVDNVLTIAMDPKLSRGLSTLESVRFYEQLVERVRGISGVQAAGVGHLVPLGVLNSPRNVRIDGYSMPPGETSLRIETNSVGESYFSTLGIPILRGRGFDPHDTMTAPRVVIINEAMAQKYWPGRDPLGMRIQIDNPNSVSAQIVGIAKTGKYREIEESPLPFLYVPMTQSEDQFMWLFVATKDDASRYVSLVRAAVHDVDPQQPIYDMQTVADAVRRQALWADILGAQIATGAAVVGLFLGVLGLYAMLSYSVSQRTREIGIRMAVGATAGRVSRMIVAQGMKLSLAGMAAGLVCAIALDSAVPEMSTTGENKPAVYGIVVAVVIAVALLSSYYPARRAARIDPNECLRSE